ncbi:MAG TPA: translation initiation factor IF-2 [bacterium]|nr:translation initiation factor IF-2 [bacterium]HPO11458.1 translation initiation factor IF-2 [bacterium]HQL11667.1 translation initiation factor IF-2 [bacterium]
MPSISISNLARKLRITNQELLDKAVEYGFDIGRKAIKINDKIAEEFIQKYKEEQKRQKNKEKINKLKNNIEQSQKKQDNINNAEKIVKIGKEIVVNDFAEKLNMPVTKIIELLMKNGVFVNLNQSIDFDTATIIAEELGYKTEFAEENKQENLNEKIKNELKEKIEEKNSDINCSLIYKPPVVVVMGHVDHGKTKLLDAIAHTNKVDTEQGGITQQIGAFEIERNGRTITFIDTPGHEAFQAMRARGGEVADAAILLVAANEGVKQQTIEAIKIIEQEKLPFVVAINKIDLPDANVDMVKSQLSELNLIPEEWGGNTICVEVSAMKNIGINELLDLVLLTIDINKDKLLTNPCGEAMGVIIESKIDKNEGVKATTILQTGTLNVGDDVIVNGICGRVKLIKNSKGEILESVLPGHPVEILGLKELPNVGDIMEAVSDRTELKRKLKEYCYINYKNGNNIQKSFATRVNNEKGETALNIIIKCDFFGSSEALKSSIEKIIKNLSDINLKINIIKSDIGPINEKDIFEAQETNSIILGFNVNISPLATMIAREKNIKVKISKIIYDLIDYIYDEIENILPEETKIETYAKANVLKSFSVNKNSQIIGCIIKEGEIKPGATFYVKNNKEIVATGNVDSIKIEKDEVKKVVPGNECGMLVKSDYIIKEGDELEFYNELKVKKTIKRDKN